MKKKEDLRVLKTRARLYRGLLELMKTKTFEEIKISEICSISSVNRSTFYDHFNDKQELLQSLLSDMKTELTKSMILSSHTKNTKDYYSSMIRILLDHIGDNIDLYTTVSKINNNSIAHDMIQDAIIEAVEQDIQSNTLSTGNVPPRTFVLFYASGIINVIIDSLKNPSQFDKEQLFSILQILLPDHLPQK